MTGVIDECLLLRGQQCRKAGDDFKELRTRAAMWQDDMLTREVDSVLNGCFELNSTEDWATLPPGMDGKKEAV